MDVFENMQRSHHVGGKTFDIYKEMQDAPVTTGWVSGGAETLNTNIEVTLASATPPAPVQDNIFNAKNVALGLIGLVVLIVVFK